MFGAHADGLQEVAGACGHPGGFQNGRGPYALFSMPKGICYHPQGFLAVSDSQNACIRSISMDGAQLPCLKCLREQCNICSATSDPAWCLLHGHAPSGTARSALQ